GKGGVGSLFFSAFFRDGSRAIRTGPAGCPRGGRGKAVRLRPGTAKAPGEPRKRGPGGTSGSPPDRPVKSQPNRACVAQTQVPQGAWGTDTRRPTPGRAGRRRSDLHPKRLEG